MRTRLAPVFLALLCMANQSIAAEERPLQVVPSVELSRYAGLWYEIARLPNRFQNECVSDVTAQYTLQPDQTLKVLNRCKRADGTWEEANGVAKRASEDQPGSVLKVTFSPSYLTFLPFVWGDYQIIALAPDYAHALVGTADRKGLWVLSRQPKVEEPVYQQSVLAAGTQGFDVKLLVRTPQSDGTPSLAGRPRD